MNLWKPIVILADYFFGLVSFVGKAIDDIDWWFDDEPRSRGGIIENSVPHDSFIVRQGCEYIIPKNVLDKHQDVLLDLNKSAG